MSPNVMYTSHDPMALLLTTPLPPSSLVHNKTPPILINDILTRLMSSNVAYRMVLHPATPPPPPPPSSVPSKAPPNHIKLNVSPVLVTNIAHQLNPTSLTRLDVQLFTNHPCSLMLLINSIQRHSLDLMSNFSPTILVTNVAHQLNPTSLTGLDVQLFPNRPCP